MESELIQEAEVIFQDVWSVAPAVVVIMLIVSITAYFAWRSRSAHIADLKEMLEWLKSERPR